MSPPLAADLADGILPCWCKNRTLAVLRAYFDESGIHASSRTTVLSGFIGSRNGWRRVARRWLKVMNGKVFHYKEMRQETALLERLATILNESDLQGITSGFVGDWEKASRAGPQEWRKRFPSCYHFILESCVQQMEKQSELLWDGEPIALTFSRQDQYAKRAEEIWRLYKHNGLWKEIVGFAYGEPNMPELQAADMLAYEMFQTAKAVFEDGRSLLDQETFDKWPLVKGRATSGQLLLGTLHSEDTLREIWRQKPKFLINPDPA